MDVTRTIIMPQIPQSFREEEDKERYFVELERIMQQHFGGDQRVTGNLEVGGEGYFEFITLDGEVWDDINIGGVNLAKGASNQPTLHTIDDTSILTYAFDGGTLTQALHGNCELNHTYKEGTDLKPHAHFYPTTAGTGNVKIFLDYWIKVGEDSSTTIKGTLSDVVAVTGQWNQIFASFGDIVGTNIKIGAQMHFRIYRVPSDVEDTYVDEVAIGSFGVHFQKNTLGSSQVYIK